ncbi:hypothetical protein BH11PLA2_BH11PLA2_50550 [soil metagenome]
MNTTIRTEALTLLAELAERSPDVRLGQLVAQMGFLGNDSLGRGLWNLEDDEFLAVLKQHQDELDHRDASEPSPTLTVPQVA